MCFFFFSSRRRHTRLTCDWSSDVCSSDLDRAFADFARRANKPVVLVANKSEGRHGEVGAMESYALGLGDPVQISAEHGEGLSDLYDALRVLMPDPTEEGEEFDDDDIIESEE